MPNTITGASSSQKKPLGQSSAENRCSARPVVPSKRIDQMNEIGGKSTGSSNPSNIEKENITSGEQPEWAALAKMHLLVSNLGTEWTACIESWLQVEEQLGYGMIVGSKVRKI